jgi:hypothetical protein
MLSSLRAPLGAALIFVLGAGAAPAATAVSSADMAVREGPGDEYKVLFTVAAGSQVDLRACNAFQWCLVVQHDGQGWVHVKAVEHASGGKSGGGVTGEGSDTDFAELPGTPGSTKKGGGRKSPTSGDDGISTPDGASVPGSTTTGRERSSQSGLSGGSGGGPGASVATTAATAPSCMRC